MATIVLSVATAVSLLLAIGLGLQLREARHKYREGLTAALDRERLFLKKAKNDLNEALDKERETFGAAFVAADKWYRDQISNLSSELRRERAKGVRLWN